MSHNLKGKVKEVGETQEFSSGFTKREFVITTDEKYEQDVKFEVVKDNCQKLDGLTEGSDIVVHFNIRGNEYNGKHYVSLSAWKWEVGLDSAPSLPPVDDDDSDSIPFN